MAVGVRLTNGMFISTPPTGVHRAAGTVESAGLSRWIVHSYLGLRLLKLEGKSCTQGPRHNWCLLYIGTCILAHGSAILYLLGFYCVSGSTGRTSHEL